MDMRMYTCMYVCLCVYVFLSLSLYVCDFTQQARGLTSVAGVSESCALATLPSCPPRPGGRGVDAGRCFWCDRCWGVRAMGELSGVIIAWPAGMAVAGRDAGVDGFLGPSAGDDGLACGGDGGREAQRQGWG